MRALIRPILFGCLLITFGCNSVNDIEYSDDFRDTTFSNISPFGQYFDVYSIADALENTEIYPQPTDPQSVQAALNFAAEKSGKPASYFKNFEYGYSRLSGRDWHIFYPEGKPTEYPGVCSTTAFSVHNSREPNSPINLVGNWETGAVYGVVGPTAPHKNGIRKKYSEDFQYACKTREDAKWWFFADSAKDVALHARLAELVIFATRTDGPTPFSISCQPYPSDVKDKALCYERARYVTASIDPRSIVAIESCYDGITHAIPHCYAISFPKAPTTDSIETDQWTLDIYAKFPGNDIDKLPAIKSVVVHDTQIIIE